MPISRVCGPTGLPTETASTWTIFSTFLSIKSAHLFKQAARSAAGRAAQAVGERSQKGVARKARETRRRTRLSRRCGCDGPVDVGLACDGHLAHRFARRRVLEGEGPAGSLGEFAGDEGASLDVGSRHRVVGRAGKGVRSEGESGKRRPEKRRGEDPKWGARAVCGDALNDAAEPPRLLVLTRRNIHRETSLDRRKRPHRPRTQLLRVALASLDARRRSYASLPRQTCCTYHLT